MKKPLIKLILLSLLLFFSVLMVSITLPYLSLEGDVKFLLIKQWVIDNAIWRTAFYAHVFSSVFLLLAGFTQFYSPLKNFAQLHRWIGKAYVLIILFISGPAGLIMAFFANGGLFSRIAFTTLGVLWLYFTAQAWRAIRMRNFSLHGQYMTRSFALTLSAITLRAWKFLIVFAFHPHPMDAYRLVAWLGWVPNLIIAEWIIRKGLVERILKK